MNSIHNQALIVWVLTQNFWCAVISFPNASGTLLCYSIEKVAMVFIYRLSSLSVNWGPPCKPPFSLCKLSPSFWPPPSFSIQEVFDKGLLLEINLFTVTEIPNTTLVEVEDLTHLWSTVPSVREIREKNMSLSDQSYYYIYFYPFSVCKWKQEFFFHSTSLYVLHFPTKTWLLFSLSFKDKVLSKGCIFSYVNTTSLSN